MERRAIVSRQCTKQDGHSAHDWKVKGGTIEFRCHGCADGGKTLTMRF